MGFKNLKIGTKLIVGFIVVALVAAIVGVVGITNINSISKADIKLYEENLMPVVYTGQMTENFQRIRVNMYMAIQAATPQEKASALQKVQEVRANFVKAYDAFGAIPMSEEMQKTYDELTRARGVYAVAYEKTMKAIEAGQMAQALVLSSGSGEFSKAAIAEQDVISKLVELQNQEAKAMAESNVATAQKASIVMLLVIAGGVVLAITLGLFLSRLIAKPLQQVTEAAQRLSIGDVEVTVTSNSQDEIGILSKTFSEMVENIKDQVQNAKMIADGDLSIDIMPKSDKDVLSQSMKKVVEELKKLTNETKSLTDAAAEGNLAARGDIDKFHGGYKEIVEGFNKTLDGIVEMMNEAGFVLHHISVNDLTHQMEGNYKGKLKEMADSINEVKNRIKAIENVFVKCAQGDTGLLEDYKKVGKRSENDRLVPAGIGMMSAIEDLINESNLLATAAINGNLSIRGNESKFEGGYKEIIEGMNKTMEAVAKPIQETADVLSEIARKDLTVAVNGDYKGDYAKIKDAMNYTVESLNDVLAEINAAAEQVETGAGQVAVTSQGLSQGASEQASSVEEISATVTEVAEQTKQNATNANKANELSVKAKNDAQKGNEQMIGMLSAMNAIKESSKNIGSVIKVIDDIAFQTNILALNAAVEAARAGEHGKGFAVVAEEVRNLAARSAKAAKETTDMIDNSIIKVEEGYRIANETADALSKIVDGVSDAVDIVGLITEASIQQATAIGQIDSGINQISHVTQENTATAEESASASEQMAGQAQMLKGLIQEFQLRNGSHKGVKTLSATKMESSKKLGTPKMEISLDDDSFGKY